MEARLDLEGEKDWEADEEEEEEDPDEGGGEEDDFDDPEGEDPDDADGPDRSVVLKWTTTPRRVPYLVLTERGERVSLPS